MPNSTTTKPARRPATSKAKTFIAGKDAALEDSIKKLSDQLKKLGFDVAEKTWLNEIEGIWSVHLYDQNCPRLFSNGKGASQKAARASALGEFFERLSTNYYWSGLYLGQSIANANFVHHPQEQWFALDPKKPYKWPKGILNKDLQKYYNPTKTVVASQLVDLNSGNYTRGICALPYTNVHSNEVAYFPVNLIGNLYVSNGMSAGNTQIEARTQALSEIFERAIKFLIIRDGYCLPDVPENVIARYPNIQHGINQLREAGFGILVKDASLGGQYPVMCVTLLHPQNQGVFASFGAHPRFEIALERALTELLQGRALNSLTEFAPPSFELEEVAEPSNLELHFIDSTGLVSWDFLRDNPDTPFVDWNFSNNTQEDYDWCINKLQDMGKQVYICDFEHLGVYACRILVPDMSEIYTLEELEWNNNSDGNMLRPTILQIPNISPTQSQTLLNELEDLGTADDLAVSTLIGLAPDANSLWKTLRVGELKTLLALHAGDDEQALAGCQWVAQYGQLSAERLTTYRCVADLLHLGKVKHFKPALNLLYGTQTVAIAQQLIKGEQAFFDLNPLGNNFEGSDIHQKMLAAYHKVWPTLNTSHTS